MKIMNLLKSLVEKCTGARDRTSEPGRFPRTKREYSLRRAQNRRNTQGASAKKNVPGGRK